jgi:hypothetical protein
MTVAPAPASLAVRHASLVAPHAPFADNPEPRHRPERILVTV